MWKYLKDNRSLSVLSCLIRGVLTISLLFESLSLCALFTEWWVFTLAQARLCLLPFYQSPSVPFHSILPRSRHCSVFPFIWNKVSSGQAQCTPVFLGSFYLFLSSSPTRLLRNLCNLSSLSLASKVSSVTTIVLCLNARLKIWLIILINSMWAKTRSLLINWTKFVVELYLHFIFLLKSGYTHTRARTCCINFISFVFYFNGYRLWFTYR